MQFFKYKFWCVKFFYCCFGYLCYVAAYMTKNDVKEAYMKKVITTDSLWGQKQNVQSYPYTICGVLTIDNIEYNEYTIKQYIYGWIYNFIHIVVIL